MRSKYILGLLGAGLVTVLAQGCGSDAEDDGTAGADSTGTNTGGTGASTGSTMSTSTGPTGGTGGGMMGDGNDSFDEAVEIEIDNPDGETGEIDPWETDQDFYKFTGTKDQLLLIFGDAKPDAEPFGEGYVDLVITLYDSDKNVIAVNDDPIPRNTQDSSLYTRLPADGEYFLTVEEFCALDGGCGADYTVDFPEYAVFVFNLDPALDSVMLHDEANETTPMEYGPVPGMAGQYYLTVISGLFSEPDDTDVYSFTIPADVVCDSTTMQSCVNLQLAGEQRTTANVEIFPAGVTGNGSSIETGKVWITTAAEPTVKIAEVDGTKTDPAFGLTLQPPVTFGTEYLLHVQAPAGADVGANPFYFLIHYGSGSNPLEAEVAGDANNTVATAEPMESAATTGGGTGYFVAGTLTVAASLTEVDYFSFDNAQTTATDVLFATCSGQRSGSGLRGLKLSILDEGGAVIQSATAETADDETSFGETGMTVPSGATTMYLKVEATVAPAADVTSRFYQCGLAFGQPGT
jgi:hypothetical protein